MSGDNILEISGSGGSGVVMDNVSNHSVFPVNLYAAQSLHGSSASHLNGNTQHNRNRVSDKANNAKVLQAIQAIGNQGKRKRGPKEKDTFQRFVYCLPDKYQKLPKFTSFDKNEITIIKAHQEVGYGYPAQAYNDGIAQKTHINLSYNAAQFREFIRTLFPNLISRKWDVYKIDKQRRLLRVEHDTPRGIKDMKYQGYLIVIPYDNDNDRPQSVIYRTGEDYFIQISSDQIDHMTLDETETPFLDGRPTPVASPAQLTLQMTSVMTPSIPTSTMRLPVISSFNSIENEEEHEVIVKKERRDSCPLTTRSSKPAEQPSVRSPTYPDVPSNNNTDVVFNENSKLTNIVKAYRALLQSPLSVTIRKEHLVDDVLKFYKENINIVSHHIRVFMANDRSPTDQNHAIPTATLFVMFWREIFHRFFKGDREYVPTVDLDRDEDLFVLLGKVLYHGLVLFDYWPVKLAQACTAVILTEKCSDSQLTTSFYNVMSESEKNVVSEAKKEMRYNMTEFSHPTLRNLCRVLHFYGNKVKPFPCTFEGLILRLSRYHLIRSPYWALSGISAGFVSSFSSKLPVITEHNVFELYARLSPNAMKLFEKVNFIFSPAEQNTCAGMEEKRTKMYLEVAIMRMTTHEIAQMLMKWCYFDCLCVDQLHIRFHDHAVSEPPIFDPDTRTLSLSSVYSSQEELTALLISQLEQSSDISADVISI